MNRLMLLFLLLGVSLILAAEATEDVKNLKQQIINLRSEQADLTRAHDKLRGETQGLSSDVDSIRSENRDLAKEIKLLRISLEDSLLSNKQNLDNDLAASSLELRKRMRPLVCILGALLLAVIPALYLYRKDQQKNQRLASVRIDQIRSEIEAKAAKLDSKLLDLAEKQLDLFSRQPVAENQKQGQDHNLALKVADEAVRIQMNLLNMDSSIRGYKQLLRAVEAIMDKLAASGYEIPDLIDKPYDDRMKAIATMILDEGLAEGDRMIRKVLKPQVNFQGKMIQAAEIVVAFND